MERGVSRPVGEGGEIGLARAVGSASLEGWPEVSGVRAVDLKSEPDLDSGLKAWVFTDTEVDPLGWARRWGPGQHRLVAGPWKDQERSRPLTINDDYTMITNDGISIRRARH